MWTEFTDKIMTALAFVWLGLMIYAFTKGLDRCLTLLNSAIWCIFILDFVIKFIIAPSKRHYLRTNWLTALALILPAFRILRIFRFARILRVTRLARVLTSVNRGMAAVGRFMQQRGFGYIISLTILVTFGGAAGMYQFENIVASSPNPGFATYADSLWWTAMVMTTFGSQYWPESTEGRILCIILALYAFAVFGYITATIASLFIARDVKAKTGGKHDKGDIMLQLKAIRDDLDKLKNKH